MLAAIEKVPRHAPIERIEMLAQAPMRLLLDNPRLFKPALRVVEDTPSYDSHHLFEPQGIAATEAELRHAIAAGLLVPKTPTTTVSQLIFQAAARATGD